MDGATTRVVVLGQDGARLLRQARRRLSELGTTWNRFRDTSSRLNTVSGVSLVVSPDVLQLVMRSVEAWKRTGGAFDPTMRRAMVGRGHHRGSAYLSVDGLTLHPVPPPAPGCAGIEIDEAMSRVRLPRGVTIDPGGIGKGLAADIVSAELVAEGAAGVLVDVAGSLRARGAAPSDEGWVVEVPDPLRSHHEPLRVSLPGGAVATSLPMRRAVNGRHWPRLVAGGTGEPACDDITAVTVFAGKAWWAEALAKAIAARGGPGELDLGADTTAVVVTRDEDVFTTPDGLRRELSRC